MTAPNTADTNDTFLIILLVDDNHTTIPSDPYTGTISE